MRYPEDLLPFEQQFNTVVQDFREEIVNPIYQLLKKTGDIVDPASEFIYDSESLWGFSDVLARVMKGDYEDLDEVRVAMYRGMCFALRVTEDIAPGPVDTLLEEDIIGESNQYDLQGVIRKKTSDYLSKRENIDSLLFSFMPEIDKSYLYNHHVKIAAALIFMSIERQQGEFYINACLDALEP